MDGLIGQYGRESVRIQEVQAIAAQSASWHQPSATLGLASVRERDAPAVPTWLLLREVAPYLVALAAVLALVAWQPGLTRWWRTAPDELPQAVPAAQADDLLRQMGGGREPRRD